MEKRLSSVSEDIETRGESKPKPASQRVKRRNTSNLSREKNDELLDQVRSLAWKGRHARAIELASQTLGMSNLKPDVQVALLDLRSESYIAQGKLDLAAKDAQAMVKIANREKKAALKAQALNRKALVQMRRGELKAAVEAATHALKVSEHTRQKHLIAQGLLCLSEAQMRAWQSEPALESGQKAIALFQELGDPSGAGRAYWSVGCAWVDLRQIEESRRAEQSALELSQSVGDQYGVGNALNALTLTDVDIAERLQHMQHAIQAFEEAGYVERKVIALGNLALTYSEMGLYPHSRRMQMEVLEITRSMGAKAALALGLSNSIEPEIALGAFEAAHQHLQELKKLAPDIGDPTTEASLAQSSGDLAFAEGNLQAAIRYYKSAVKIAQLAKSGKNNIFFTELGKACLANHEPSAALRATTRATNLHRAQSFAKPDGFPSQAIWWRHAQALNTNKKTKAAHTALDRAYDFLLESIQNIRDEGLRRNTLNKVAVNRELLQFWIKDGVKLKIPEERLYAHLNIESNLREPFKRLTDTGLRLNALKSIAEIQNFLVEEATELSGGERVLLILENDENLEVVQSILPRGANAARILTSIKKYINSTRLTRTVQLILPKGADHGPSTKDHRQLSIVNGRSRIIAPLIAQNHLLGYLYADMDSLYGTFDETDRDLLGMLANQGAVALDNAQWAQGLEQKVQERTTELQASNANLEHRNAELAIINSVQVALAANLDIQGIYDAVGDKIREIFHNTDLNIRIYDPKTNRVHYPYYYENGKRITIESYTWDDIGFEAHVFRTRKTLIVNENTAQAYKKYRSFVLPGTHMEKSLVFVPLVVGEQCRGLINLMDMEREHAFSESDVRLLQTLANSMSVALENARLFDETQRLLKETEQRNAELAIINSVQAALAAKLDMQGIYDAVGDKIRDIFDAQSVTIVTYDKTSNLMHYPYIIASGKRLTTEPLLLDGTGIMDHVISEMRSIMINTNLLERTKEITGVGFVELDSSAETGGSKSRLDVPMIVGGEAKGGISLQNADRENAFTESDLRLLQTLANSMSVALENARLFDETQRLLKETEQRNAELAIINSVQAALAAKLDLQGIYDAIGDNIRDIFDAQKVMIIAYDKSSNLMSYPYLTEMGRRIISEPLFLDGSGVMDHAISEKRSIMINTNIRQRAKEITGYESVLVGDERASKSRLDVPMIVGGEAKGGISLQNVDRENAFTESDMSLLQTLANSMGVALENARLFGETQRLLKETEQRAAELSIVNSVQEGLASKLDMQAIYDLVGDKVMEIFRHKAQIVSIRVLNKDSNMMHYPYFADQTNRIQVDPHPIEEGGFGAYVIRTSEPLLLNHAGKEIEEQYASTSLLNYELPESNWLGVPLLKAKVAWGIIALENFEHENIFQDSDLSLLQTLVNAMSIALENARLFNETQRLLKESEQRAAELAAISKVSQALVAETELDSMIQLIGNQTREIFDADIVYVALLDPQTNLIHFPYQVGEAFITLQLGEGMTSRIIQTGEPLLINKDVMERTKEIGVQNIGREALSYLGVPIKSGGETIGVISVQSTTREGLFTEDSVRLLTTIAANAGAAIHTARLHGETQRNASQMATIASVGSELSATLDLQKVIHTVTENVHNLFQATDTILRLVDSNGNSLHTALALGNYAEEHAADVILLGEGITGSIAQSGIAEVIDNVDLDPRGVHIAGTPEIDEIPQTMMVAPLIAGNDTIGVISVYKDRPTGSFSQVDLDFLIGLGRQAAFAIQNATLFQNQRIAREQTETLQAVTQVISRTLKLDELFNLILAELQKVVPYNSCSVQQWDGEYSVIVGGRGFPNLNELLGLRFPTVDGDLSSYVLKGRQPYILEDVSESYPYFKNAEFGGGVIHGWMGVPLIYGDQTIGMLTLDKHEKAFYTSEHAQLAMAFAAQAAVAIENARLFDTERLARQQAEVQSRQMATIANVGRDLSATLDLEKVIRTVVENVHDLFQARDTILRLTEANGNSLRTALALGKYADQFTADVITLGKGITGGSAQSGIAEVIDDLELDPRRAHVAGTPEHYDTPQTMMVAPLIADNRNLGVLTVYRDRTEGSFSQVDLDFLVGLGRQAAIAIENSRLFDETQRLLKETERRATELQIINDIGLTLTEGLDLNSMIERLGDKLREALNVQDIRIAVADTATGVLTSSYVYRHGQRIEMEGAWLQSAKKYKLAMRLASRQRGRAWVVNTKAEKSWRKFASVTEDEQVPKSFIMLPLLSGDEVIGGINIPNYDRENAFIDFPTGLLETIASNIGTAIQNVRLFDVTKRLFKEAEEARASAEQANKAKSTFLANMSHELRTPLNAIIGFTRIVRKKAEAALPEKQIENLDKVLASSEHLLGLINTILDIAKIEAGRMDVIPARFDISSLADQCANLATPLLKPNVTLEKQVDETVGIIFSDQDKIKQIVINLLSNAAKFTHEGRILLSVQKINEDVLNISVTDSGIGIKEEALGRVFEEFQQADNTTTRQYGGTGLGLAISRNLARLLGGDLTATSKLGKGSTFSLTVPTYYGRKPASQPDENPTSAPVTRRDATKHHVLLIDDDPDALYLLQEELGVSEFDVMGARSGHDGLQIAREQHPEAILLDILMPETDGWQILNDLKSDAATTSIPVILLTIVDKKALGFKLGAAEYLLKPLNPAAVLDALRRVIGGKSQSRKCALIVDDDPHVAEMLRQTLPATEFELDAAEDGEAGLQAVRRLHPDVILLDLMMPKLDGFGMIEQLNADPELQNIPIIVISAKDLTREEARSLKESVDFVVKKQGLDTGQLIQEINAIVKR